MKPIVDYIDFRSYMQDYYDERKRTSVFSWREFSGAAGFTSPSYIKVVCDGKSKLSRIGVERVGQAMGLVGFEMEYFRAMVVYGQEENDEKKKAAFEEMLRIAKVHKVRVLEGDVFNYFESWLNPVMRELAPLMPGATPGDMAKKCCAQVSAAEVKDSVDFLTKAGLLKKTGEAAYQQTDTSIKGTTEATGMALRSMHRQMAGLAADALELPLDQRNFTGVTMGVSKGSYNRIVKVLEECRRQIVAIASEDTHVDQVYRVNLQLFPLTKSVNGEEEKSVTAKDGGENE